LVDRLADVLADLADDFAAERIAVARSGQSSGDDRSAPY
jgi:hypothetical protein